MYICRICGKERKGKDDRNFRVYFCKLILFRKKLELKLLMFVRRIRLVQNINKWGDNLDMIMSNRIYGLVFRIYGEMNFLW